MTILWLVIFSTVLVWSGIQPKDPLTWWLEVAPALIGFAIMACTYKKFRLTGLLYFLILAHAIVLMIGGHYTYAEVPLFDYIKPIFGFERNNYDKLGHFFQGFVPAIIAREIFIRLNIVQHRNWLHFIIISICLAFSAFYEMIEWLVALASGESAEAFLGTQGFVWDTQTDMAMAMTGAICALLFLSKWHDHELQKLPRQGSAKSL